MITHLTSPSIETIAPADAAAVAEIVRRAAAGGTGILPVSSSALAGRQCHPSAVASGIRLSLENLNRVIDYTPDDMTITVEAGVTVAELNRRLAENRQWLPVDVPWPERTTVGEAIAAGAAGPRRYAYGTIRDYLLGFTAVDGTGMIFSGGGRVVKNAAGYNMCRLMAGSRGALGIITQATLMVRPLPESAALLACEVREFESAEKLLAALVRLPIQPVAVELSAGRPPEGNPMFGPMLDESVARLFVGFEGAAEDVAWMLDRLNACWSPLGMTAPVLMPNLSTDKLWRWIAEFPEDERIGVLPGETVGAIVELLEAAPDCSVQAHAGDGIIRVRRGSGDGELKARDRQRETDVELRLMRAIKERFDPKNILEPLQVREFT